MQMVNTQAAPKRFFQLDDEGTYYLVVSTSLEGAKQLLRESHCVFGHEEAAFDAAAFGRDEGFPALVWTELAPEQVAKKLRCHTENERGVIKLSDADIGDWFSSEW
jgi:hypothetical protein